MMKSSGSYWRKSNSKMYLGKFSDIELGNVTLYDDYLMSILGLSLPQNVQTRSRTHTASYSMGTGAPSQG